MAEIATDGLREAIRQLEKADLYSDENIKAMLNAGAEIMMRDVKSAFVQSGHNRPGVDRRTGETFRHITRSRTVKRDKNGIPYMQITLNGKDSRGQRYGTKAFVLNYGRRKGGRIAGDYYWSNAVKNAWKTANDAMSDVAAQKLKGE